MVMGRRADCCLCVHHDWGSFGNGAKNMKWINGPETIRNYVIILFTCCTNPRAKGFDNHLHPIMLKQLRSWQTRRWPPRV